MRSYTAIFSDVQLNPNVRGQGPVMEKFFQLVVQADHTFLLRNQLDL